MNKETKNKRVAIVTGGGSGIGLAIAEKFVQEKISTVIIGRDAEKLNCAKEKMGDDCHVIQGDLTKLTSIPGMVQMVMDMFGHIDILVNNAGVNQKKAFMEVTDDEFQRILFTNVNAVFALSREVVKNMLTTGSGTIINISSMASHYGLPKVIAYTASKAAVEGMTRAMAVELSPRGIRVNCIAPGFISTDMSAKAMNDDPERMQNALSRTPIGHFGEPSDIAATAFFLASDQAKYITGVILPVDGGNSIGF